MTNNLTGLAGLIIAVTGLVTAIGTLYLHLRSHNAKSQKVAEQPPPAQANDAGTENRPFSQP